MKIDLTKWKDGLIVARELIFVALFLLLLFSPAVIKNRLEAAGFKKLDLGFAQWEAEIEKSRQEVAIAKERANEAERKLTEVSTELTRLSRTTVMANSPAFTNQVGQLKMQVDQSAAELRQFDQELERSVQKHDQLLGRIQAAKGVE